jgi:hypothetical protein
MQKQFSNPLPDFLEPKVLAGEIQALDRLVDRVSKKKPKRVPLEQVQEARAGR